MSDGELVVFSQMHLGWQCGCSIFLRHYSSKTLEYVLN